MKISECETVYRVSSKEAAGLAQAADCPPGWYEGPWFDDAGELQTGPPPCLFKLIMLARGPRGFQS